VTRVPVSISDDSSPVPAGAVAVIVKSPGERESDYHVRFTDGREAALKPHEFAVRKVAREQALRSGDAADGGWDWDSLIIYRCVVGSRAYGLDDEGSDTDRRGIYLPPAELDWSLHGAPEQLEDPEAQECYWELRKFLLLALKANPNILECLYTPLVETATPLAEELLAHRDRFLSRLLYQTYNGYVMSQFKKLETDLRLRGEIRWKHAMHLVRLLLSGITVLAEGVVPVRVEEHRERLLAIRRGATPWDEVNAWRLRLHAEFDAAHARTRLPEAPDHAWANAFLIRARRSVVIDGD
jgi:predicted nucleotidyltransferase